MTYKQESFLKSLIKKVEEKLGNKAFDWLQSNLYYTCNFIQTGNSWLAVQMTSSKQASEDISNCLALLNN